MFFGKWITGGLVFALLGAVATAGFYYVQTQQKDAEIAQLESAVTTLTQNVATLESGIEEQKETIDFLQTSYANIQTEVDQVNQDFNTIRQQNDLLRERLAEHDLGYLAESKPGLIENIINRGTDNAGRCFELLSGAPLTDQERNAENGNEFNRECPGLWPDITYTQ
jgi:outer membrane murein-binding lipoprotein Lpp